MATVVITFFLTRFYVFKMDADFDERRRSQISLSLRENRWSMNSQRLEEIVAELMKPISDLRRSFDTDLSALLEEYLTEAGLHALEAAEEGDETGAPNFPELALLLQQSASIYSRKVDFLYQHVLDVSDSLQNSTLEMSQSNAAEEEAAQTPSTSRRKRKASVQGEFRLVSLEACGAARREAGWSRPPPVLPRVYVELEPRVLASHLVPATDYAGEPIGVLADFHVCWRLQDGLLVEELSSGASVCRPQPLSLLQLQAALPPPEPLPPPPGTPPPHPVIPSPATPCPVSPPPYTSTPLPEPQPTPPARKERKRKMDSSTGDLYGGGFKISISEELRIQLDKMEEFSVPEKWISNVVRFRSSQILKERARLQESQDNSDFLGFDSTTDIGGFCGWANGEANLDSSVVELSRVTSSLTSQLQEGEDATRPTRERDDSDDDGFFEQSSLGDSDTGRIDDSALAAPPTSAALWAATQAWAAGAGACDVSALAARVVSALAAAGGHAPGSLLQQHARRPAELSHLFLATLFLANSGNVSIERGPALSLNSFSLRLQSEDASLYSAAAAEEPLFAMHS